MNCNRPTAIVGAGLMGHGIALVIARAGGHVSIADPSKAALADLPDRIAKGLAAVGVDAKETSDILDRVTPCESLKAAVKDASFVFEAVPERLDLKQAIFAELEAHAPADAILASNTSVIPITQIAEGLSSRHRALGTHWWNPPHLIPLVEVIRSKWTGERSVSTMLDLLRDLGKKPVVVEKDVPGFIGNRLQHALWREAISLVERGVCSAEDVDTVVKCSFGRRMTVLGPMENADLIGTDLTLDIHENVLFDLDRRPYPSPYLCQLVADGKLGMSVGCGFRNWTEGEANAVRNRVSRHLAELEGIFRE